MSLLLLLLLLLFSKHQRNTRSVWGEDTTETGPIDKRDKAMQTIRWQIQSLVYVSQIEFRNPFLFHWKQKKTFRKLFQNLTSAFHSWWPAMLFHRFLGRLSRPSWNFPRASLKHEQVPTWASRKISERSLIKKHLRKMRIKKDLWKISDKEEWASRNSQKKRYLCRPAMLWVKKVKSERVGNMFKGGSCIKTIRNKKNA